MTTLTQAAVQTYTIDPSHSRLGFSVRHLGFAKVRGSFEQFEGVVRMAEDDLSTLEAEATVQTKSVATNDAPATTTSVRPTSSWWRSTR